MNKSHTRLIHDVVGKHYLHHLKIIFYQDVLAYEIICKDCMEHVLTVDYNDYDYSVVKFLFLQQSNGYIITTSQINDVVFLGYIYQNQTASIFCPVIAMENINGIK